MRMIDPDTLGQLVRRAWLAWARRQPDPKPSWLVEWQDLDDGQKTVDREIGAAVFAFALREIYQSQFGATGEFPEGKIAAEDEGELKIGISAHADQVYINLGVSVHFMAFGPEQAFAMAQALIDSGKEANRESKAPAVLSIRL